MGQVDAIYRRRSIRKYLDEELHVGILEEIKEACQNPKKLYEDIDMDIHVVEDGIKLHSIIKGIVGSYGKIKAPHYLVVTSEKKEGYLENVGFAVESIVLQLTDMEIGTCWTGRTAKKELLGNIVNIKDNHEAVIVVCFGYPKDDDGIDKIIRSRKRLEITDIVSGNTSKTWHYIMDAVRMAPSSMNSQPWRFFIRNNIIDVYCIRKDGILGRHMRNMNRIGIGIALYHLYAASDKLDKNIEIKKLEGKGKEGYFYITSVIEKEEE
jgi:nitroreductase